jgi:nucleoside-diphosphate-sugar epimerase
MIASQNKIALVVGAAGGIGGETAASLARQGWAVRGLTRRPQPPSPSIAWLVGDAMRANDVLRAADGVSLIVHAANPPGYRNWATQVLPMVDNTIAAAKAVGARIVLPGTIYNFGPNAFPVLREDSPQHPVTRKGAIRVEMEARLKAASETGAPVLIVRAGDFFGPRTTANSIFSSLMVRPGVPVRRIIDPVRRGSSHAWAYLPDVGETIARLMNREPRLGAFEVFNFAGYQLDSGEMAAAIRRVSGNARAARWPFPWPLIVALQPAVPLFRELAEMRDLWIRPIALDGGKLAAFLGADLPATPLDAALRETLAAMGCLPDADPAACAQRPLPAAPRRA